METLPAQTKPASVAIRQRHTPEPSRYSGYRACLRWDFGFCCPFCLVHEADLTEHGVERTGLMTIEHLVTRSADPGLADAYANCRLACRYCNTARNDAPRRDVAGRWLLDPCEVAWGSRFQVMDTSLAPSNPHDPDATYTYESYDLDDPRRRAMRARRAEAVGQAWRAIGILPSLESRLLAAAVNAPEGPARAECIDEANFIRHVLQLARQQLRRYHAVPLDAPSTCRCGTTAQHRLPDHLAAQSVEAPE